MDNMVRHYVGRLKNVLDKLVASDIKAKAHKGFVYREHRAVPCGYELVFMIPLGLDPKKIRRQLEALSVATGTIVELEFDYPLVIVRIVEKDFPQIIKLDPSKFRDDSLLTGYTRNGDIIYHPFDRSLLEAGAAGAGKTELIRLYLLQMIMSGYQIHIIDLKRFSFHPFKRFSNVHIETTLKGAKDALQKVADEMDHRADLIEKYEDRDLTEEYQKIAVIIDEAAEIAPAEQVTKEDKEIAAECDKLCSHIARLGREVKALLMYTTQRPSREVINGQVKANVDTKIAFRTSTAANSFIILDRPGAEQIRPEHRGRCIYSGPAGEFMLQVPYVGNDAAWRELLEELLPDERFTQKNLESAKRAADGIHCTIGGPERQPEPNEKVIAVIKGTGARKARGMDVVRKNKTVEDDEEWA